MREIRNFGMAIAVVCMVSFFSNVWAQESTDETTDAAEEAFEQEKKNKQREFELLELDKKIADKKKELAKSEAPDTETTGQTGSVDFKEDLNNAGYFAEIIAYETLNNSAEEIAEVVIKNSGGTDGEQTIVLTTEMATTEHAALWSLLEIKMGDFTKAFEDLNRKHYPATAQPAGFNPAIPLYLGGLVDIANFFKVNQEIYGREVALNDSVLMAEVAKRILAHRKTEGSYKVIIPSMSLRGTGKLFTELSGLVTLRSTVVKTLDEVKTKNKEDIDKYASLTGEIGKAKAELKKLRSADPPDPVKIKKIEDQIAAKEADRENHKAGYQKWVDASREIGQAKAAFDTFYNLITTPPEKGKKSTMEMIAPIDAMKELEEKGLFVVLDIVSQGGEANITKSLWSGGRVNYIGGSVSLYFIIEGDGQVVAAGSSIQHGTGAYKARGGVKTLKTN